MLCSNEKRIYREDDYKSPILKPIPNSKSQTKDYVKQKFPKYIAGYTGFIPTLNFRYGKTYAKAADDSIAEFSTKERHLAYVSRNGALRSKSLTPIRHRDDVTRALKHYEDTHRFKPKNISADDPPIAGYTGHIPRVKGNEESLSQRYDTVVRRGLKLLREEREKRYTMKNVQEKISAEINNC